MRGMKLPICLAALLAVGSLTSAAAAADGPLTNVTVSFGAWKSVDRHPNFSPTPANHHQMLPDEVKVRAGGSVNFVISGFHQVAVYEEGVQPEDIDTSLITPTTGTPPGVPLIDDPNGRIYRGPDPSLQARDRVEAVMFPNPGTYLVICTIRNHFVNDKMWMWVKVV